MDNLLIAHIKPPHWADQGHGLSGTEFFGHSVLNYVYEVSLGIMHPCALNVARDADLVVLENICELDCLPLIADRRCRHKLTVYKLTDDALTERCRSDFSGFDKGHEGQYVLKLLMKDCDGIIFASSGLQRLYGHLNAHTYVLSCVERSTHQEEELFEFLMALGRNQGANRVNTGNGESIFHRLSRLKGARRTDNHLHLIATRFENLLHQGLILRQDSQTRGMANQCFSEAMRMVSENYLPFLLGASCFPDAVSAFNEAIKRNPQSLSAWLLLADEEWKRGAVASSLGALEKAAKIASGCAIPYIRAAKIMRHLCRKKDWLSLVDKAESLLSVVSPSTEEDERKSKSLAIRFVRPKRVLLVSSENGMVYHNCVDGFKDLGWEVIVELFGTNTHNEPDAHEKLALKIRSYSPHLVLSINQAGCDSDGYILSAIKDSAIPVVIWYVDNPFALFGEDNYQMVKDASLLACFDSSYVEKLQRQTGVFSVHLPHAANPNRFRPPRSTDFVPEWDISFVGNLGLDMVCRQRSALDTEYPDLKTLADQVTKRLTAGSGELGHDLFKAHAQLLDIDWDRLPRSLQERVRIVIETDASSRRRLSIILELENLGIKVVGGPEWRRYLSPEQLIPPVDYLNGLCRVYQNSRISLNISRLQLRAGVNQRIFDVPAGGGFLLTDRTTELEHYLVPHEEVACYCDAAEVKEKAKYYLSHEKERAQIAAKARKRILQEHTYTHRMEKVLKLLELH